MHHPTDRIAQTTQPLLHQLWSTGWNEKQLNGSTMRDWSNDHHAMSSTIKNKHKMLKSIYVILRVNDRGHFNIPVSRVGHYLVFIVLSISTAGSQHKHLDTRAVFMCFLYHRTLAGYTLQHIAQLPLLFHNIELCWGLPLV